MVSYCFPNPEITFLNLNLKRKFRKNVCARMSYWQVKAGSLNLFFIAGTIKIIVAPYFLGILVRWYIFSMASLAMQTTRRVLLYRNINECGKTLECAVHKWTELVLSQSGNKTSRSTIPEYRGILSFFHRFLENTKNSNKKIKRICNSYLYEVVEYNSHECYSSLSVFYHFEDRTYICVLCWLLL